MIDPWDGSPESHAAANAIARDLQAKIAEFARRQDEPKRQAIELMQTGMLPDAIAAQIGVTVDDVWAWQGEALYFAMGYPAELAEAKGRSSITNQRDPATTTTFDALVARTFVPPLKQAGYRKTRLVWQRRTGTAWPTIDIQRGWSNGDLLEFTCNWAVRVPGYGARMFPDFPPDKALDAVLAGHVGDLLFGGNGGWWSVQLGRLARDHPTQLDDATAVEAELREGLSAMLAVVDGRDSIGAVLEALDRHEMPNLRLGERGRAIAVLRALEAEAAA